MLVRIAEEEAARLAPDLAEALAAFADGRRIDERQYLFEIAHGQCMEQRLVRILQFAQESIALEIGRESTQDLQPAGYLLVERADLRWQQAMQVEHVALGIGEGRTFVEQGRVHEIDAGQTGFDRCVVVGQLPHGVSG